MNISKHVTLLYLGDKSRYNPEAEVNHENYYISRQMPIREMFGKDTIELAEELIAITTSVEWRRQQRRPIMCGDIMCEGLDAWMYVPVEDLDSQDDLVGNPAVIQLRAWPRYAIKQITSDSVRETICKHPST